MDGFEFKNQLNLKGGKTGEKKLLPWFFFPLVWPSGTIADLLTLLFHFPTISKYVSKDPSLVSLFFIAYETGLFWFRRHHGCVQLILLDTLGFAARNIQKIIKRLVRLVPLLHRTSQNSSGHSLPAKWLPLQSTQLHYRRGEKINWVDWEVRKRQLFTSGSSRRFPPHLVTARRQDLRGSRAV